jgi:hypothetical protein
MSFKLEKPIRRNSVNEVYADRKLEPSIGRDFRCSSLKVVDPEAAEISK